MMKFIVATAIFYAMLAFNVFHVGESIVPAEKDYINSTSQAETVITSTGDQYIQDAIQTTQNPVHGAAPSSNEQSKFDTICSSNTTLCKVIKFESTFTNKEKYIYLSSIFKVVKFINEYLITQQKAEDTLQKISISNDNGQRRGYATHDTIVLNLGYVASSAEFLELVNHEMGHILDLGILQGTDKQNNTTYTEFGNAVFALDDISLKYYALSRDNETIRKSTAVKKDFCSGYGMSDPFEDLAECVNLYTNHNTLFKAFALNNATMRKKFNFIAGLFNAKYISKGSSTLGVNERPRDTTKI
ncbi:MAG: hypothetical protein NTX91_01585 [candidate division SR1 bacterium]|nr:hypothetical protein [candidate division SR1 bacterium]